LAAPRKYDVVVIGGGIGGYPTAIRLSQRGLKVALVEERYLGGECTNYGCVPSKAIYRLAESFRSLRGFVDQVPQLRWRDVRRWIESVVERLRDGIGYLLDLYGADLYQDKAVVAGDRVRLAKSGVEIEAREVVIATGTDPRPLPGVGFDGQYVVSNRELFYLDEPPGRLLIVGGGVIGVEIAYSFSEIGTEVVVVEALDRILPMYDRDVSRTVARFLRGREVKLFTSTTVTRVERRGREVEVTLSSGDRLSVDRVLVAIGRVPRSREALLGVDGVKLDRHGYIAVGDGCRAAPGIRAVGDVAGPPLLAHKALIEGLVAAESIAQGRDLPRPDPHAIPTAVFTGLEVAIVGYSEEELRRLGVKYRRYRLPIGVISAALIKGGEEGFVKLLVEEGGRRVLGIHIVAPNASEVVSAMLPLYLGMLSLDEASRSPYPHLTVSEAVREAAELVLGEPIHVFVKR